MIIRLKDIQCYAYHGVLDEEKKNGNTFRVEVEITLDETLGTISDDIQNTLDYRVVCDVVKREMGIPSELLERVAKRIKDALAQICPQATNIKVVVAKKNPPLSLSVDWAEVEI